MKRFYIILTFVLSVVILAVNVFTASYSWFTPGSPDGVGLSFDDSVLMSSESCSVSNYQGTKDVSSGITYTSAPGTISCSGDSSIHYFKTTVTNSNTSYPANVSIFFKSISSTGAFHLGIKYPSNTYRDYSSDTHYDVPMIRNAYVKKNISTDADPGLLEVEWFIKVDSGTVTIDPAGIYILYE